MILVLASTSPRRRQILIEAGFPHDSFSPGIDDAPLHAPEGAPPKLWAATLALLKAKAAEKRLATGAPVLPSSARPGAAPTPGQPSSVNNRLLLAADTIVVKEGMILGQPMTDDDARATLKRLSAGSHSVITAVALLSEGRRLLFADEARVFVGTLGDDLIDPYVASGSWRGKAGAYNLMERLADNWPITFTGDPATIMGLPIRRLTPILTRLLHRA